MLYPSICLFHFTNTHTDGVIGSKDRSSARIRTEAETWRDLWIIARFAGVYFTGIGELAKEAKKAGLPLPLPSPTMANNSRRLIKGQPLRLADDPWLTRRASLQPFPPLNRNARKRGARSIDADKRVGGQAKREEYRWKTNRLCQPVAQSLPILQETKKRKESHLPQVSKSVSPFAVRFEANFNHCYNLGWEEWR